MADSHQHHPVMWGGRFEGDPDPLFRAFNDSLPFDWALVQQDLHASAAWAKALVGAGVFAEGEASKVVGALDALAKGHATDRRPPMESGAEDVHGWIEQKLVEAVGDLGKKLHSGRSRNDQVATAFRLWTREAIDERLAEVRTLATKLAELAQREASTPFPAYTHLQRAQPITFGHWCLAYVEMLLRDTSRLSDARDRMNECPLDSAALAGTTAQVDRAAIAKELGFDRPTANSLDGVSDRDFVCDALYALSMIATHLSRFGEDLIIYTSDEFGLVKMDDGVTSGSSLMPQKRNPDALELLRGKCGRVVGSLMTLLITLKAQPLAYNKDLQEDKRPLFDAMHEVSMCLRMAVRVVEGLEVVGDRARKAATGGYSNATDLADAIAETGTPFREAHEQTGKLVRLAIERGVPLEELPINDMKAVAPKLETEVLDRLTLEAVLAARNVEGGTSPDLVVKAASDATDRITKDSNR